MHDADLLRGYLEHGSEAACTELVKRYVNLVYATAHRQVGAPDLAEAIQQIDPQVTVPKVSAETLMAGWAYANGVFATRP